MANVARGLTGYRCLKIQAMYSFQSKGYTKMKKARFIGYQVLASSRKRIAPPTTAFTTTATDTPLNRIETSPLTSPTTNNRLSPPSLQTNRHPRWLHQCREPPCARKLFSDLNPRSNADEQSRQRHPSDRATVTEANTTRRLAGSGAFHRERNTRKRAGRISGSTGLVGPCCWG